MHIYSSYIVHHTIRICNIGTEKAPAEEAGACSNLYNNSKNIFHELIGIICIS